MLTSAVYNNWFITYLNSTTFSKLDLSQATGRTYSSI